MKKGSAQIFIIRKGHLEDRDTLWLISQPRRLANRHDPLKIRRFLFLFQYIKNKTPFSDNTPQIKEYNRRIAPADEDYVDMIVWNIPIELQQDELKTIFTLCGPIKKISTPYKEGSLARYFITISRSGYETVSTPEIPLSDYCLGEKIRRTSG